MPVPRKTSTARGSKFVSKSAPKVKVARDGGHNLGTSRHCAASRAHPNVRGGRY